MGVSFPVLAQHNFIYVAETNACAFYMDSCVTNPQKEVWEKRYLLNTDQGRIERQRIVCLYPKLKLDSLSYYYVKQQFDFVNLRTRNLAIYFFDAHHNEIGDVACKDSLRWEAVEPGTIAEMEMNYIKKIFQRGTK